MYNPRAMELHRAETARDRMRVSAPVTLALLIYVALAIVWTSPLLLHLHTHLPSDPIDPGLNTWILWWNSRTVPLTTDWWNAPSFFPLRGSLALAEHLLGISVITTPVQWLGGTPVLAYNLAFLISFALSAIAAHLLCFCLTRDHVASVIAGLAYGFAPYRAAQIGHIQVLSAYWAPVALACLHRYMQVPRARWLFLFGLAWLMQALSCGYYLFYFSILVLLWILWFADPVRNPRAFVRIGAAWAMGAVPLLPVLFGYLRVQQTLGLTREIGEIRRFSADIVSVLGVSPDLTIWSRILRPTDLETALFPGAVLGAVVVWGILVVSRGAGARQESPMRVLRTVFAATSLLFSLTALSVAIWGPWRLGVAGVWISVSRIDKELGHAFFALLALAVTSGTFAAAYRRRSVAGFYLSSAAFAFLMSLGPTARFCSMPIWDGAPYAKLMLLPGFSSVRVPARFWMVVVLCLAASAGIAFRDLRLRLRVRPTLLFLLCGVGLMADGWIGALPLSPTPVACELLDRLPSPQTPVLELPIGPVEADCAAMYRGMSHGHPVVNGYGGYFPPHYAALRVGLKRRDPDMLSELASIGPVYILIHRGMDSAGEILRYASGRPDVIHVSNSQSDSLYLLRHGPPTDHPVFGTPAEIASIKVLPTADSLRAIHDGDVHSPCFIGASQTGSEQMTVQLAQLTEVTGIRLYLGRYATAFPRKVRVEVPVDGRVWKSVWLGSAAPLAFRAALSNPREMPMTIVLPPQFVQSIRLKQLAKDPTVPWVITEIEVISAKDLSTPMR
ncbi:MAG: hypothetical protein AB1714_13240 [Acidobacteriota bacterium]